MKLIAFKISSDFLLPAMGESKRIPIDLEHVGYRNGVAFNAEIGHIREEKAQRVPDAAIGFNDPLQNFIGEGKLA
jgi:hypothetical protein